MALVEHTKHDVADVAIEVFDELENDDCRQAIASIKALVMATARVMRSTRIKLAWRVACCEFNPVSEGWLDGSFDLLLEIRDSVRVRQEH
mgnify:CR=1 FL=1